MTAPHGTLSMVRTAVVPAVLTGSFCAVFAVAVDGVLSMVGAWEVAILAGTSGFLGSLFARFVMGARK